MVDQRLEVDGVEDIRRGIKRAKDAELTKELKQAGAEGAEVVAYEARTIVDVLTGALEETIRSSGTQDGGVVRAGSARVVYAGVNHFGWPGHGIEPNPFLYDAADNRADEVTDIYYKRVVDIADDIERRGTT